MKTKDMPGAILFWDQMKAFDRIQWPYMFQVLKKLGFTEEFVKWIQLLYQEQSTKIKINNHISESFMLNCGVRQGDPLSPLLFVLCIEPLIQAIINDPNIKGISLPDGTKVKITAYADDVATFASDDEDIQAIERWLEMYEAASGAKFNPAKSEGILHKKREPQQSKISEWKESVKYLGTHVGFKIKPEKVWEEPVTKLKNTLNVWKRYGLSLFGKVTVIKNFALPCITYQASVQPMPRAIMSTITNECWKFLWSNKKASVNIQTSTLPKEFGGLGYPDIPNFIGSLQAKWIIKLLKSEIDIKGQPHPWTALAKWNLENINHKYGQGLSSIFCKSNHQVASNSPSQFWAQAIQAFWKTEPSYNLEKESELRPIIIRSLPLFNNPIFTSKKGLPLKGNTWNQYAKRGICRLIDIIFYDHLGSREEIYNYHGWCPPKRSYKNLIKAIPQTIKTIIHNDPLEVQNDGHYGYKMNHNTHRLLFVDGITEDGYFANTFEVQEPFSENVEYMGRLHFTDKVNPRPIKALFDEDGVLQRIEYLDINPLFPKEIHLRKEKVNFKKISTSDLRRLMKSTRDTPKNQSKWETLVGRNINWKSTYSSIWKAPVPKKWVSNYWLLLRLSFFLGDRAQKHNWEGIPHNCQSCNQLETHQHLFLECPKSRAVLDWIRNKWSRLTNTACPLITAQQVAEGGSITPNRFKGSQDWKPIWQSLLMAGIWAIWKARCEDIYDSNTPPHSPQSTLYLYKNTLKTLITHHLHSRKHFHLVENWTHNKTLCYMSTENTLIFVF